MGYFGHVFGCSCWGATPPQTPRSWQGCRRLFGLVFCQSAERIRKLAKDKKPSTGTTTKTSDITASFFHTPLQVTTLQAPKDGRRYSPQGGFNPPPNGVGVLDSAHGFCQSFLPSSFRILLLGGSCFPLLNPPPVASGRLLPLRRKTALAPLGASWAEKIAFQEAFKN